MANTGCGGAGGNHQAMKLNGGRKFKKCTLKLKRNMGVNVVVAINHFLLVISDAEIAEIAEIATATECPMQFSYGFSQVVKGVRELAREV